MTIAGTFHEKALAFGAHLVLAVDIASPVASVDFGTSVLTDTYDTYVFEMIDMTPVNVNTHLAMVVSVDGSSFPASNLSWQRYMLMSNAAGAIAGGIRDGASALWHYFDYAWQAIGLSGWIMFCKGPPGHVGVTEFRWMLNGLNQNQAAQCYSEGGGGSLAGPAKVVRFYFNGGTIQSGKIRLYGLVK